MSAVKVCFPQEDAVKVHQTRVKPCPDGLLAGYYWYGNKWKGPGRLQKWVEKILSDTDKEEDNEPQEELEYSMASIADVNPSIESAVPDELTETKPDKIKSEQVNNRMANRYSLRRDPKPAE